MATGSVKGEKHGNDALTAGVVAEELYPLPADTDEISLVYPNKISEEEILHSPEHGFLKVGEKAIRSINTPVKPNGYVLADNFFALQKLFDSHKEQVTLIYLDPPFQTGLEFQSRQLKHSYKDLLSPAAYLEFMRRRLILMRELLASEGSIYLHIGHQMVFHLKVLMDEVFGRKNFRNMIVRKKCSSKNYTKNQYPNLNDYILFYTKSNDYKWNQPGRPPEKEWIEREYPKVDERGRFKLVPIHAPGTRNGETGKKWKGMSPPPGKHWQQTPAKLDELDAGGFIHWSRNGNPRRKVYLPEDKMLPFTDYWSEFRDAHHQSIKITGYPTEKNLDMMKVIVSASSDAGDLVLDPFCGSGTTMDAAQRMGRKWLGVDESFSSAETVINRFGKGLQEMGDYVKKKSKIDDLFADGSDAIASPPMRNIPFNFYIDERLAQQFPDDVSALTNLYRGAK